MRGAPAQLPDQGMAQGQGQQPSKLDELQGRLDQQAASSAIPADLNGVSVTDLKRKLSNLRSVKHLADGGAKQDAQCQNIEAEIRRRENPQNIEADIKRREDSHNWLNRAKSESEANHTRSGNLKPNQAQGSHPEESKQQRNERLRANRDFEGEDEPSTSKAQPQGVTTFSRGSSQSRLKAGHPKSLTSVVRSTAPMSQIPMRVSSKLGRGADRRDCSYCKNELPVEDLRHLKGYEEDGMRNFCSDCWATAKPNEPFPPLTVYQMSTIRGMKSICGQQSLLQPAPVKPGIASRDPTYEPSQGRKVSARQSAKLQKQQEQQKQADNEPICIDSDEDDHAAGSAPARESDQNGAGPALRRSERSNAMKTTTQIFKDMRCVYPVGRKLDVVEMTEHDLARLDDGEFLNDTVIDFFAKWIQEHLHPDSQLKFHFFNTFFFKKLTEKSSLRRNLSSNAGREGTPDSDAVKALTPAQRNHLRVKSWTKGVDIFSKDFLLIPIHGDLHWSLIIVCHPGLDFESSDRRPYILHLDSMEGSCHNLSSISTAIRTYLNVEWQRKLDEQDKSSVPVGWVKEHPGVTHNFEPTTMPGKGAHVPCQDNYCDCGLFVLAYLDFWTHAPPDQVELCARGAWKGDTPYPAFLSKHWFQHENASALREHIRNLILGLFREQKRLPDDHPSVVAAVGDMEEYRENTHKRKYCSPADYLADARAAHQKREEEKAKREARLKEEKERKAAEHARKQAEVIRKAGEKAAEREKKRKQQEMSQEDNLEVALSSGSDREGSPAGFVPPDFVTQHQPRIEDSNKRLCKQLSQGEAAPLDSGVQDLTAESPEEQERPKMQLRSGHTKVHGSGQAPGSDQPNTRCSSRRRAAVARQRIEDSDDDADLRPDTKRQLMLSAVDKGQPQSEHEDCLDPANAITVPDSQPEERQPETQDLTQEDHITAEVNNSADLVDEADQMHHDLSQDGSDLEEDAGLQEHEVIDSWHSHGADDAQHQQNGSGHLVAAAPPPIQWNQALLDSEPAEASNHLCLSSSEQMHHERIRSAQQHHIAQASTHHQAHLNPIFRNPSVKLQSKDGYANLQSQQPFSAPKVSRFFAKRLQNGIGAAHQTQEPHQELAAVPGQSHDDREGSPINFCSNPSSAPPHSAAAPHLSPLPQTTTLQPQRPPSASTTGAAPTQEPYPFPEPSSVFKSAATLPDIHPQSGYPLHQYEYPPPDVPQPQPPHYLGDNHHGAAQGDTALVKSDTAFESVADAAGEGLSPRPQTVGGQASEVCLDDQGVSSPSAGRRRRASKSHRHQDVQLAARTLMNGMHPDLSTVTMMTVPDKPLSPIGKRVKLSPPAGLLSPAVKAAGAQWPALANSLHQHGVAGSSCWEASTCSLQDPGMKQAAGAKASGVLNLFQGVQAASGVHGPKMPAPELQQGSGNASLRIPYGIVAASREDLGQALSNVQTAPPAQQELIDIAGHDSAYSLEAANAEGAQLQRQLQQQQQQPTVASQHQGAGPGQPSGLADPPNSHAIDLCEGDMSPERVHVTGAFARQQQIEADEQMARSLEQTGAPLQQLNDHASDNNDSDYQPSPQRAKRSEASGRKSHSNRRSKQTQGTLRFPPVEFPTKTFDA